MHKKFVTGSRKLSSDIMVLLGGGGKLKFSVLRLAFESWPTFYLVDAYFVDCFISTFMDQYYHTLSRDFTRLVSHHCPIIVKQVVVIFTA